MTRDEATAEARRRWGPNAYATQTMKERATGHNCKVWVSTALCKGGNQLKGRGATFEAAFANADERAAKKAKRS